MKDKEKQIEKEKKEKRKLTPKWVIAKLTGLLFAAYSAYNVFVIFRDYRELTVGAILISAAVALAFGVMALYAWTTEIKKYPLFRLIRRVAFMAALLVLFTLKMRMIGEAVSFLDATEEYTVMYFFTYSATQAALLILLIYYIIILRVKPLYYPMARFVLPIFAAGLFLFCLILEMILLFVFKAGTEGNALRTMVMRPVFYLGFIGLSAYFSISAVAKK